MARETSAAASESPAVAVFIDTTLDTHIAVLASSSDTVGAFKEKIRAEHVLCFPNIGEIIVQSMKVRRRGSYYHLSDSMLIKSAFDGTKGTWFLYMDVISASHQAETSQNEINQNGEQLQTLQLDKELNVMTIGCAATRVQGLVMNGSSDGNNPIPKDTSCVLEKQPLIDTGMKMLSSSDNSSLQHAGICDDHFVLDEGNVPNHMALIVKDLHDGCNEKRSLKEDGPLRKSERKKGNNGPPKGPIAIVGSCAHSKEALLLETDHHVTSSQMKHKNDPVSPEKLYIEQLQAHSPLKDLTKDEKKKKKKRRKVASGFVDNISPAIPETCPSDASLDKSGAFFSPAEQIPEENPIQVFINNNQYSDKESDETLLTDKATRNVTNADYVESGSGRPLSTNLNLDTMSQSRFSYVQSCNDYPIQEQVISAEPEGQLDGKRTCLGKEAVQVAALRENPVKVDSEVPTISQFIKKKSKSGSSRKASSNQNSLLSSAGHAAIGSLEEASGNQNTELNKESDLVNSVEEAVDRINSVDGDSGVPCDANVRVATVDGDSGVPCDANVQVATPSSREKSKKADLGPSHTSKVLNLSGNQASEDNPEGRSDDHHKGPIEETKDSTIIGEAANLGNSIGHDSVIPSNPKVRSTHRRKKKSSKTELLDNGSINGESIHSLAKEASGENLKEMLNSHKEEGTECKGPILGEEAAVPGNLSMENFIDPGNPNGKNSQHRRKKSAKAELFNHVSIDKEPRKEAVDRNTKGTTLDSHKELREISNSHEEEGTKYKGPLLADEAAVPGNLSVEVSTDPGNHNEKNSQRRRKKSAKAELTNHRFIDKKPGEEATDRITKETTEGNHKELHEEDKTSFSNRKILTIENSAENNPAIPLDTKSRNSLHHKRKRDKTENFEKSLGAAQVDHGNEFTTGPNPDGMIHDFVSKKNIDICPTGLPDESSNKHDTVCHFAQTASDENTEGLLAKTNKNSENKIDHDVTDRRSEAPTEENNYMEHPKSDTETVKFIEFFVPKIPQLESHTSARELSSDETGARNKEKLKRKRRSKMHSVDSTADLMDRPRLHEQNKPKKKRRDGNPVSHSLADPSLQLIGKEPKSARKGNEETRRNKFDSPLGDNSSEIGSIKNSPEKTKLEKEPQIDNSGIYHKVPVSKVEQSKHLKGNSAVYERKFEHISCNKDENITESTHGNQHPLSFDNSINNFTGGKALIPNRFSSPDISLKGGMADLAASSDSTEDVTPSSQYRVAVRKVPHSRNRKNLSDTNPQKNMLASTGTIFNDAISGSSDDEFRVHDRKATSKALSDTSSTSASSEGDLEETRIPTSFKPHAYIKTQEVDSAIHGKPDEQNDGIVLSQSSTVAKKSKHMSDIFRSSSSYRKAKLTASQSQIEDSEDQPFDVVLET